MPSTLKILKPLQHTATSVRLSQTECRHACVSAPIRSMGSIHRVSGGVRLLGRQSSKERSQGRAPKAPGKGKALSLGGFASKALQVCKTQDPQIRWYQGPSCLVRTGLPWPGAGLVRDGVDLVKDRPTIVQLLGLPLCLKHSRESMIHWPVAQKRL